MHKLPDNLLQALADYLSRRPYAEVYQLISALSKLEKYVDSSETPTETGN